MFIDDITSCYIVKHIAQSKHRLFVQNFKNQRKSNLGIKYRAKHKTPSRAKILRFKTISIKR